MARGDAVASEAAARTTGCVLVVDNDQAIRDVVAAALRDAGYTVRTAGHGAAALPMIAFTASAADATTWAREIGAAGVLLKPFELDSLYAIVARHIRVG